MSDAPAPGPLGRALQLLELGRLEQAERMLRDAITVDPGDPVAHATLALVLSGLGRDREAENCARAAIALDPELSLAHTALAEGLAGQERFDDALVAAREAIRLDPTEHMNHELIAGCSLASGDWQGAQAAAERALALEPESATAHGLHALALAMRGDDPQVWRASAAAALKADPGSSAAHALAANAHLLGSGERRAVEGFEEALRLDPESEYAQAGLAAALKAAHPLFRPLFRFFIWQDRLSGGARTALIVVPLVAVNALRPYDGNPVVLALLVAWIAFVVLTWVAEPIANLALRSSRRGRAILPAEQRRSSTVFAALVGACLLAVLLAVLVDGVFAGTAFAIGLLAFTAGSSHQLSPRRRRILDISVAAAVAAAYLGAALFVAGIHAGVILLIVAMLAGAALTWFVRLA